MQKSFLLALGAFVIAAFMFVMSEGSVKTDNVVTSFEVSDNGIKVNNSLTGEEFVISDETIAEMDTKELMDIAPASGDEHHEDMKHEEDHEDMRHEEDHKDMMKHEDDEHEDKTKASEDKEEHDETESHEYEHDYEHKDATEADIIKEEEHKSAE